MEENEVELSSSGELSFKVPQQFWTGNEDIQSSYFSGQQMFIKKTDQEPDMFEIHYLGLKVPGFENLDDAKYNAPAFAKSVFQILGEFVKET